jgi:hypothetical protein
MAVLSRVLQLSLSLLVTVAVNAIPFSIDRRGTVPSNEIVGFPETVPGGETCVVYEAYQPLLHVVNGCVPFPAVDAEGDTKYALLTLKTVKF